jgi:hypothetical protein
MKKIQASTTRSSTNRKHTCLQKRSKSELEVDELFMVEGVIAINDEKCQRDFNRQAGVAVHGISAKHHAICGVAVDPFEYLKGDEQQQ